MDWGSVTASVLVVLAGLVYLHRSYFGRIIDMVCCRRAASPTFALVTEEEAQKGACKAKIVALDKETFMKLSSLDFTR